MKKIFDLFKMITFLHLQGRGSYEDRTEMLRLIVDLVEASMYADNPEWRSVFLAFWLAIKNLHSSNINLLALFGA